MFTLRQALVENQEQIARLITQDMGKTLPDAYAEVGRAIEMVDAPPPCRDDDAGPQPRERRDQRRLRDYRRPMACSARSARSTSRPWCAIVPALAVACGDTFVLKPSEQVRYAQEAIFELIHDLELLPPGVSRPRQRRTRGRRGRCPTTRASRASRSSARPRSRSTVYERSARAGQRVQALGRAEDHMVVMPDAVVDKTVRTSSAPRSALPGQRCMAGSVLVTVGSARPSASCRR